MRLPCQTLDVFTEERYGGNPLAVFLEADVLSSASMQSIAAEFGYSETAFVMTPRASGCTHRVRIFTPREEIPFAGHPNVGTAVCLALRGALPPGRDGEPEVRRACFEEGAGPVEVEVRREEGRSARAAFLAPAPLVLGPTRTREEVAGLADLPAAVIRAREGDGGAAGRIVSAGLPFLAVELESRDALARARPVRDAFERTLPAEVAGGLLLFWREEHGGEEEDSGPSRVTMRVFAPLHGIDEDPATGSAAAALSGLLALEAATGPEGAVGRVLRLRISQGEFVGRPARIDTEVLDDPARPRSVRVSGSAVPVLEGWIDA